MIAMPNLSSEKRGLIFHVNLIASQGKAQRIDQQLSLHNYNTLMETAGTKFRHTCTLHFTEGEQFEVPMNLVPQQRIMELPHIAQTDVATQISRSFLKSTSSVNLCGIRGEF